MNQPPKKILIVDNGGTVSMKRISGSLSPVDGKEDILKLIYQIKSPVEIDYLKVNSIDSTNLSPPVMKLVYDAIVKNYSVYHGFVVLTGTDTLAYVASFLSFWLLEVHSPVIITGSQKPLNELGSDAPGNIYYSILFAKENIPGVSVFFWQKLYMGNRVTKVDSRGFDAFDSPKHPPAGHIDAFNLRIHTGLEHYLRPQKKENFNYAWSPHVAVIKLYPGFNPELLKILPQMGYRGLIIEAFGLGNLPNEGEYSLEETVKEIVDKGMVIGICSQCLKGAVQVEYETARRFEQLRVIFLRDITPEAAYAKLSYLLGISENMEWIRIKLSESMAGEMSIWDE
ncbi:MAG: asparaginase [Candidatus Eremiobacterota bacterium]